MGAMAIQIAKKLELIQQHATSITLYEHTSVEHTNAYSFESTTHTIDLFDDVNSVS